MNIPADNVCGNFFAEICILYLIFLPSLYIIATVTCPIWDRNGDVMNEKDILKYQDVFSACFLFRGMDAEQRRAVLETAAPPERFAKGESVYRPHLFQRALTVVMDGELQVTCSAGDRKRAILNTLRKGDVCGVTALYSDDDDFVTEVTVTKSVTLLRIQQSQLSAWMAEYPLLAENYIRFLTDRIRFLNQKITTYTGGQADDRLWRYLQDHCDDNGCIQLSGSVSELARILDVGRSSLYRSLDALEQEGKLERQGKRLKITFGK